MAKGRLNKPSVDVDKATHSQRSEAELATDAIGPRPPNGAVDATLRRQTSVSGRVAPPTFDVGVRKAIYREARDALARQRQKNGFAHLCACWQMQDIVRAIAYATKVSMRCYSIVELWKEVTQEAAVRRKAEAEARRKAEQAEQAHTLAVADAKATAQAQEGASMRDTFEDSPQSEQTTWADNNGMLKPSAADAMLHQMSNVLGELRSQRNIGSSEALSSIMSMCQSLAKKLSHYTDIFASGLQDLNSMGAVYEMQAKGLAAMVGRLKSEMERIHKALQAASDVKSEALAHASEQAHAAEANTKAKSSADSLVARRERRRAWQLEEERRLQHTEEPPAQDAPSVALTFQPGDLGMKVDGLGPCHGRVNHVVEGGHAERVGVEVGMVIDKVDHQPYTEFRLDRLTSGQNDYNITFKTGRKHLHKESEEEAKKRAAIKKTQLMIEQLDRLEQTLLNSPSNASHQRISAEGAVLPSCEQEEIARQMRGSMDEAEVAAARALSRAEAQSQDGKVACREAIHMKDADACSAEASLLSDLHHEDLGERSCCVSISTGPSQTITVAQEVAHPEGSHRMIAPDRLVGASSETTCTNRLAESLLATGRRISKAVGWAEMLVEEHAEKRMRQPEHAGPPRPSPVASASQSSTVPTPHSKVAAPMGWHRVRSPPPAPGSDREFGLGSAAPSSSMDWAELRAKAAARPVTSDQHAHRPGVPSDTALTIQESLKTAAEVCRSSGPRAPTHARTPQALAKQRPMTQRDHLSLNADIKQPAVQQSRPTAPSASETRRLPTSSLLQQSALASPPGIVAEAEGEDQRSTGPELGADMAWREAWDPQLGAISRAQRLQNELSEEPDVYQQTGPRKRWRALSNRDKIVVPSRAPAPTGRQRQDSGGWSTDSSSSPTFEICRENTSQRQRRAVADKDAMALSPAPVSARIPESSSAHRILPPVARATVQSARPGQAHERGPLRSSRSLPMPR